MENIKTPWVAIQSAKDAPGERRTIMDAEGERIARCESAAYAAFIVACVNAAQVPAEDADQSRHQLTE